MKKAADVRKAAADSVGGWEVAVGWAAGGILGFVQGAVVLSDLYNWMIRTPILFLSFLLHVFLGCVLALVWGSAYLWLGRKLGRSPSRVGGAGSLLSFLVFLTAAVYINVTRLPGTDLLAPISLALTGIAVLVSLALFPLWRAALRPLFSAFEARGGLTSRTWLAGAGAGVLAVVLVSFIPPLIGRGEGRTEVGETPSVASISQLPDVVVFVMDTTRSDHLSCYGYGRPTTPFLETLASRGILFEDVVSPSPWTLPSHASILSGRFPHSHGAHWQHWRLDDSNLTLPEILRDRGYATGAFVSNPFLSETFNLDQGFDVYDDELESWVHRTYLWRLARKAGLSPLLNPGYSERRAEETAAAALRWVDGLAGSPCFLFVNFNDPHAPYDPPQGFRTRFLSDPDYAGPLLLPASHDDFILIDDANLTARDMRYLTDLYDGEILYLDAVMERLLRALEARAGGRGTLVVVTADHGESFGEHGLLGHRGSLYNQTLSVPLLVAQPGVVPRTVRVSTRVQTIDIAPTILELLRIAPAAEMEGRSLAPLWDEKGIVDATDSLTCRECFAELYPELHWVERYPWLGRRLAAIYADRWKLIWSDAGSRDLYDLAGDPDEETNLASSEPERTADLAELLSAWQGTIAKTSKAVSLDSGTANRLRSLGYLQ